MLEDKYDVEEQGLYAESELAGIPRQRGDVASVPAQDQNLEKVASITLLANMK